MSKKVSVSLILCLTAVALFALSARELVEKNDALPQAQSAISTVTMKIYRDGALSEEKEFRLTSKKINGNRVALTEFIKPTRIKFLTHENKNGEDDQWLKTSSGKPKRIAGQDKGKSFVHSHFFYEDLQARSINDYDYVLLGEAQAAGTPCHKIEAVRKSGQKVYSKAILYLRKSDCFMVRTDLYQNGVFLKYVENLDVRNVNGILTPFRVVMSLADGRGKTELLVKNVQYNVPVYDSIFNKGTL